MSTSIWLNDEAEQEFENMQNSGETPSETILRISKDSSGSARHEPCLTEDDVRRIARKTIEEEYM